MDILYNPEIVSLLFIIIIHIIIRHFLVVVAFALAYYHP